jgi:hypothetical protein
MSDLVAKQLNIDASDVIVASTGVIGQPLSIDPIAEGLPALAAGLSAEGGKAAAEGIMTTDTVMKEVAVEFTVGGKTCHMGGIAKGSGMIHPNMATMLVFLTTDCAIAPDMLQKALSGDIANTFNMISVDGDTSTNDMVSILANGMAGNEIITAEGEAFNTFMKALNTVTIALCRKIGINGKLCKHRCTMSLRKLVYVALAVRLYDLTAIRANDIAVIFNESENLYIHKLCHINSLFNDHRNKLLRTANDDNPIKRKALENGERYIARSGRHINEHIVHLIPNDLAPELLNSSCDYGTSPYYGLGLVVNK